MKLLLVFALLALICAARTAPTASTTRELILPAYGDDEEQHVDVKPTDDDDDDDDDVADDAEKISPTTTTSTTRRSTYVFPTRNRNLIPSRRPPFTQRTSSVRTTTEAEVDETTEGIPDYDGDFRYIRDFRVYVQKLLDDIKKLVRNLTGYNFDKPIQRPSYNPVAADDDE